MTVKEGNVYRYKGQGRSSLVRVRAVKGAFAEIREPKSGYRLGRRDLLTRVSSQEKYRDTFSRLD